VTTDVSDESISEYQFRRDIDTITIPCKQVSTSWLVQPVDLGRTYPVTRGDICMFSLIS